MWNPVEISLTNFGSHQNTKYSFENDQTTMIYGTNLSDEGADSNGSGKSTIIRAITLALTGYPNKDISKEDYIMDDESKAIVEFTLDNRLINRTLTIKRTVNRNASDTLQILENGELNDELTSVATSEARVIELLDISKEDILNYFIINQDNSHSFFKAGDNDKKKIISRFTNSSIIDKAIEFVEQDLATVEETINSLKTEVEIYNGKIDVLNEQVEYEKTQRAIDLKQELTDNNEELRTLKLSVDSSIKEMSKTDISIKELNDKLKVVKTKVIDETSVKKQLSAKKFEVSEIENEISETKSIRSKINSTLSDEIECPKCKHVWSTSDPEANIEELKTSLSMCEELIKESNNTISEIDISITSLRTKITKASSVKEELEHCEKMIGRLQKQKEEDSQRLERKKKQLTELETKIKNIREFKQDTKRIKDLTEQITTCDDEIDVIMDKLSDCELDREKYMFWKINFGMSGFKTYLVNKVLSSVEGYVNFNLSKFKTNLLVKINGYKVLKSGKVNEKIDVLISKNSGNWNKFNRFSGGQRERVNVAGIITLQKLINMSSKTGGLNILALDETFEHLDTKGQQGVLKILEQNKVTTLVVSHLNNDIGAKNRLDIQYEDGISKIL